MNNEKILEIARRYTSPTEFGGGTVSHWGFWEEDLIAFAQSVIEEEQEKYQELIAAAEAAVYSTGTDITAEIDALRDVIERMKNDDR